MYIRSDCYLRYSYVSLCFYDCAVYLTSKDEYTAAFTMHVFLFNCCNKVPDPETSLMSQCHFNLCFLNSNNSYNNHNNDNAAVCECQQYRA